MSSSTVIDGGLHIYAPDPDRVLGRRMAEDLAGFLNDSLFLDSQGVGAIADYEKAVGR